MKVSISVKDAITPDLRKKIAALQDRRPVLEAAGAALVSLATRAFTDASLRAAEWPPYKSGKKKGQPVTLVGPSRGHMKKSIAVTSVTNDSATVSASAAGKKGFPYPAVHQLGGGKIPRRPFFPFLGGVPTEKARANIGNVIRAKLDKSLGQS